MEEASGGRVTITIGPTGRVLKRSSDIMVSDSMTRVGTKRPVRDRLGSNVENSLSNGTQNSSKRQRGDTNTLISSPNAVEDLHIGKDDLRHKIKWKKGSMQAQSNDKHRVVDLREMLPRTPVHHPSSMHDARQLMPGSKETRILEQTHPTRSSDDLSQIESSRNTFSAWSLDQLRRRSPDGIPGSLRYLSTQRDDEDLLRRSSVSTGKDFRYLSCVRKDVLIPPRPIRSGSLPMRSILPIDPAKPAPVHLTQHPPSMSFLQKSEPLRMRSTVPMEPAKPAAPLLTQHPPPSSFLQKNSYIVGEQLTVDGLLQSLGLGKYAIPFKAEEVDMTALKQMGENDLKELGIPMGPRKKILLALTHSRRQL